jgi:TolB-like protein/DNA-binding winged helix-turn-helix (wHTH) protein/Tfp pilus assembly protein PilF
MAPQAPDVAPPAPASDEREYQVDDLIVDLGSQRVTRSGRVIPLPALSFDLLVALVRAAPNLLTFEQLGERVWPGVVATPETISQRVKLVRNALGDDSHAPRYIEAVRGRGYRMVAHARPLTERHGTSESIPGPRDKKVEEIPSVPTSLTVAGRAVVSSPSATPPAPGTGVTTARGPLGWIGGALIILAVLGASWAIKHYRGASRPAELTRPGTPPAIHSLAVLPLENLSGDKEQEYFADGMTDTLITNLAQIGSLRVISRTSAMQFKGSKESLPQIGRDLKVDAVVEGTVARSEGRVRVTAQLVEASSDHNLWAKSYEHDLKDVLILQDEIARDVAEQIRVKLTPKERSLLIQVHAVDPEAYDATLRGWFWWNHLSAAEDTRKALDYFNKAIAKDPGYAPAYAGIALSFLKLGFGGGLPFQEAFRKTKEAALKALELDPSLEEAHTSLAAAKLLGDWDWSGAESEHKEALALSPNSARAHLYYSNYLVVMGRLDEATKESELARDLDPLSPVATWFLGRTLYNAHRYDDALRQYRLALEMRPDDPLIYEAMADAYEQKKTFAEAFAARQQALTLNKDPNVTALGEAYKRSGYRGYLLKKAQILEQPHNVWCGAHEYALLNDEASAMTCLERAYQERFWLVLGIRTLPEFDSIRSSPRFRDLVRRIGFPPSPSDKN